MAKNNDQQFASIRVVGGLLGSKILQDVRFYKLPGQSPSDYGVEKGLKLNDELSRYWRIAQTRWQEYKQQCQRTDISQNKLAQQDWLLPLLEKVLGYSVDPSPRITLGEREFPVTHTAHNKILPLVLCGSDKDLDKGDAIFGQEGRKRSPMGLAQEYLNAESHCLWAIVSNGTHLRLLRDNPAMTRPAYIEVDFSRLFDEDNYADFATLWLLLHATRTANQNGSAEKSWLEQWRGKSLDEGERIVEGLRYGVADALRQLGTGFVAHPENKTLRAKLSSGELTREAYFQQVLRLVYRLLFLLTAEDREIALLPGDENKTARELYERGYSVASLRDRARFKRYHDLHGDAWQQLLICFSGFANGQPLLAQPALGGIFAPSQCSDLDNCKLQNHYLYSALFKLCYFDNKGTRSRINYRDMNTEEFGSVYEALLELTPQLHTEGQWRFSFQGDSEGEQAASGNARKLSGSYYTPDSLVQELIKSALVPVIEARLQGKVNQKERRDALLSITVCDPACGSGHFLLGAARRLAAELAQIDADSDQPTEQHYRHALRDVLAHCVFGVDKNPMAIELARVAMWIEGVEPGRALSFLDHHLVCGDALMGISDFKQLEKGIPAAAFKPLSGDDKMVCQRLSKINSAALKQVGKIALEQEFKQIRLVQDKDSALSALNELEAMPSETTQDISAKESAYRGFLAKARNSRLNHAADLLLGAFLQSKTEANENYIPTTETLLLELISDQRKSEHEQQLLAAQEACIKAKVLHWPLAFPQVFARDGFDCVLGNPPWERIKLQEEEYFSSRSTDIALAKNKAERTQRIEWLAKGVLARNLYPERSVIKVEGETERRLFIEFVVAKREAEAASAFVHVKGEDGGRYPLTGVGDVNTYALFAETISQVTHKKGRAGFIVPTGIATDDGTKTYFSHLAQGARLVSICSFENEELIFRAVHHAFKFCILTIGSSENSEFVYFARQLEHIYDARRRFRLMPNEFSLINPNTLTCPVFRSGRDAELTKKLYRAAPVLIKENVPEGNSWGISFMTMFHMSNDSLQFFDVAAEGYKPLYEAKMVHQFDHRWATYNANGESSNVTHEEKLDKTFVINPRYWVPESEVEERLTKRDRDGNISWRWDHGWLMGWRDITNATNERSVIASIIPRVGVGHTMPLFMTAMKPHRVAALFGNLNALVLDFVARVKIGGTHLTYSYLNQFPVLPPSHYSEDNLGFIVPRILELTYNARDMEPWAKDLGYNGEAFAFDPYRRACLRAELDAYYAKLYGLTRDELRYILDPADVMGEDYPSETFRVLKNNELKEFGEYRTRRLVLEAWDKLHEESTEEKVVPLQIAASANALDTSNLSDGAWARPQRDQHSEMGVQLIAVLKALSSPVQPRQVRRAVAFALEPRLLNPFLTDTELASWQRLIGAEADTASTNQSQFVARANQFWGAALRFAMANGHLHEDSQSGMWFGGTQLDQFPAAEWADGRARMVLQVLARQSDSPKLDELPIDIRDWIDAEAA